MRAIIRHLLVVFSLTSWLFTHSIRAGEYQIDDAGMARSFELSLDEIAITRGDQIRQLTPISPVADKEELARVAARRTRATGEDIELVMYEIENGQRIGSPRVVTREVLIRANADFDPGAVLAAGALKAHPSEFDASLWIASAADASSALDLSASLRKIAGVVSADPLLARQQFKRFTPNDPLFTNQWHLRNTGQSNGVSGTDIRVTNVWAQGYRGTNIYIAIIDDGLQTAHPDLAANVDTDIDWDFNSNDNNPNPGTGDDHGTACAGVAAAVGNNSLGVSGSAPQAKLVGLRLIAASTTDSQEAQAINWSNTIIAIKSNSWGPSDNGTTLEGPGTLTAAALSNTCAISRGGRGSLIFWAGGNGLQSFDDSNLDGYANAIYTISIAANDIRGQQSWYSEPGANHVVCAPSSGDNNAFQEVGIMTVDRTGSDGYASGDYTGDFGGTSSATPLAAGVGALMIEANPNLGWRDVQEILIRTATRNHSSDSDWRPNGAGIWFNHKYGGGMINASGAVARALTWTNLGPQIMVSTNQSAYTAAIPDNNADGITRAFTITNSMRLEHVVATVNINHARRRNLRIELISPANTTSVLAYAASSLTSGANFSNWSLMTVRNWGELAAGTWTLRIADRVSGTTGTNTSARLTFYGTSATAASNQPPVLAPLADQTVIDGRSLTFNVVAADPVDQDPITLTAPLLPAGASFNATGATGQFTWASATPMGTYTSRFVAADKDGAVTQTISIAVIANQPPVIAPVGNKSVVVSNTLAFTVSATDPVGEDAITLSALDVPAGAIFNPSGSTGSFSWSNAGPTGEYAVTFLAADISGTNSQSVTITVTEPPVIDTNCTLIISEYIEGSSNNKAIELYNGTGASIDLAAGQYMLQHYNNGSATPSYTLGMTGVVASGSTFVIANASANSAITSLADLVTSSQVMTFNGDDAIVLRKDGSSGPVIDAIGQTGVDPGVEWGSDLTSTADNTIRRRYEYGVGRTNTTQSFDPSIEWEGFAVDTFDGLGSHSNACLSGGGGEPPPTIPAAPAAIWVSITNATDFTAAWSAVSNAESYRLDVATNASFASGGGGGGSQTEPFASMGGGTTSSYLTRMWTNNGVVWTAYKARTDQTINGSSICLQNSNGAYFISGTITGGIDSLTILSQQKFAGSGGTFDIFVNETKVGSALPITTNVTTHSISNIGVTGNFTLMITNSGVVRPAFDDLTWTAPSGSSSSLVPGYQDRPVAATSQLVTGLTEGVTYYFRARAVNVAGTSPNSPTGSVVTTANANPDLNSDGIPDAWLAGFGFSPTNEASAIVPGQDFTFMDAFLYDIDPGNPPANFNRIEETAPAVGNSMALTVNPSSTGRVYDVYWRTDLGGTNWTSFGLNVPGTGGEVTLTVTNDPPLRFYRTGVKLPQ